MNKKPSFKVLRIDSSANPEDSITRTLGDEIVTRLTAKHGSIDTHTRDVANHPVGFIDESWVAANFTDPGQRSDKQQQLLAESDAMVAELANADAIILTVPLYNFSIPATLKAWIDKICRARLSFEYTEQGPRGLLKDKPVYLVMASGGVAFGSEVDFASDYLRQIMAFIGITDIRAVFAGLTSTDRETSKRQALNALTQWLPEHHYETA